MTETFCNGISGIVLVNKYVSYDWLTVTLETIDQSQLMLVTLGNNLRNPSASNAGAQSPQVTLGVRGFYICE